MKHMMRFEIINPIVGAFQTEANGWDHAQELANGAEVRLVQSRQVYAAPDDDEIGEKVKMTDLLKGKLAPVEDPKTTGWNGPARDADLRVATFVVCGVLAALSFAGGFVACLFYRGAI